MLNRIWCYQSMIAYTVKNPLVAKSGCLTYFLIVLVGSIFCPILIPDTYNTMDFPLLVCAGTVYIIYAVIQNRQSPVMLLPCTKNEFVNQIFIYAILIPFAVIVIGGISIVLFLSILAVILEFFFPGSTGDSSNPGTEDDMTGQRFLFLLFVMLLFLLVNTALSFIKKKQFRIGGVVLFNLIFFVPLTVWEKVRLAHKLQPDLSVLIQNAPHSGSILLGLALFTLLVGIGSLSFAKRMYAGR